MLSCGTLEFNLFNTVCLFSKEMIQNLKIDNATQFVHFFIAHKYFKRDTVPRPYLPIPASDQLTKKLLKN